MALYCVLCKCCNGNDNHKNLKVSSKKRLMLLHFARNVSQLNTLSERIRVVSTPAREVALFMSTFMVGSFMSFPMA